MTFKPDMGHENESHEMPHAATWKPDIPHEKMSLFYLHNSFLQNMVFIVFDDTRGLKTSIGPCGLF